MHNTAIHVAYCDAILGTSRNDCTKSLTRDIHNVAEQCPTVVGHTGKLNITDLFSLSVGPEEGWYYRKKGCRLARLLVTLSYG